jgi:hypothetical protein
VALYDGDVDVTVDETAARTVDLLDLLRRLTEAAGAASITESTGPDDVLTDDPEVSPYRTLLESLPLDQPSFQVRFQRTRTEVLADLRTAYTTYAGSDDATAGFAGLVLLTLMLIDDFDQRRIRVDHERSGSDGPEDQRGPGDGVLGAGRAIVADPRVQDAIRRVYAPVRGDSASREAAKVWSQVDFSAAELYRIGSTSLIVRARARALAGNADPQELAVKCVLLPFAQIPAIAKATADYSANFHIGQTSAPRFAPTVWASTRTWIVMTFIAGHTLAEELGPRADDDGGFGRVTPNLRLDRLADYVPPILDALSQLQRQHTHGRAWVHADLAPSNIIVTRSGQGITGVVFVDLGRNFLYSRAIGGLGGVEGAYVAPEVRDDEVDDSRADLYSVGKLIVRIADGDPDEPFVPNAFYERVPALARFVEDLIDREPASRLLVYRTDADADADAGTGAGREWNYADLKHEFARELDAVREAEAVRAAPFDGRWLSGVVDLVRPGSRSPSRQWRLYRERIRQGASAAVAPGSRSRSDRRYAGWLALWSLVCATTFYLTLALLGKQILRDLGNDPTPTLLQGVASVAELADATWLTSTVDWLRDRGSDLLGSPGLHNAPARIVAVFFTLVCVRYYQNIFAGLMPLLGQGSMPFWRRLRAWGTELLMRVFAWWWAVMIVIPNLGYPRLWPIATAIGIFTSFLLNYAVSSFANSAVAQARRQGVRTVPAGVREITGLRMFEQWTPSQGVFAVIVAIAGFLIYSGRLQDEYMYVTMLSLANITIFYVVKTSLNAPEIRAGLTRAFLASERTQLLRARRQP